MKEADKTFFAVISQYMYNNCFKILLCSLFSGLVVNPKMYILRMNRYTGPFMYFVMAMEFVTVMFVFYFTVREYRKIKAQKIKYFKVRVYILSCLPYVKSL